MTTLIVNDKNRRSVPTIAIDARLVAGTSTGDSTYWTGLLYGLSRVEAPFRFLLFSDRPRPEGIPWSDAFEWITLPARSSRWWSLVSLPLAARRRRASAVHVQYSLSPLAGRRGITTIHDVSFLIGPEWFRPRDRMLLSMTVPAAARRAARVITVSETSRGEIERLIPGVRPAVTPLACPPWISSLPRAEAAERVRAELGIEGPFLLSVSTRWPRKNMGLAVAAAEALSPSLPQRLVLTGKAGWGDASLGARAVATGYVSNEMLSALYSAADLYLSPSRHEGFGIPLLEAFRCGCPVVCSSGGALPEVAGDAAYVERSWEPEDWARSIERLLGDRGTLEAMRDRGHARERLFSWEETARRTLDVYREVAT